MSLAVARSFCIVYPNGVHEFRNTFANFPPVRSYKLVLSIRGVLRGTRGSCFDGSVRFEVNGLKLLGCLVEANGCRKVRNRNRVYFSVS